MSFNVFSTIAGGITVVGGGFGIYLWSSRENNANAENVPTKTEKPTEKTAVVEKPKPKPKRKFLNSGEKTSGKILSVIKDDTDYTKQITPYTLYECAGISCTFSSNNIKEINLKLNSNKVLDVDEIKADTKLPYFYFDYGNNPNPDKPEDLDFSKLKQIIGNSIKFQKYLLIFGNKDDQTANQKFSFGTGSFYRSLNPNQWGNQFDEDGKLVTSSSLKMEILINNVISELWWKPIFALNENFDALDKYEDVMQKFSEENKNSSA